MLQAQLESGNDMEALLEANLATVDNELLSMQKMKSRPSVVIEEFVDGAGSD